MASSSNISTNSNTISTNQTRQTTFSFITPIKLDLSNHMLWRNQVLACIRGNWQPQISSLIHQAMLERLLNLFNRLKILSKLFGDLKIRHYLADCLALSLKVFSVFFTLVTLYDVWRTLKKKFGVQSEARVLQLRYEMNIMRKSH